MGVPVADTAGGLFAALAVVSALLRRQTSGDGAYLDALLTDAALSLAACRGLAPPESRQHLHPANDLFHCRNGGVIAVGLLEDHFFDGFVAALGAAGAALRHPDFSDMASRQRNGNALHSLLEQLMATRDAAEWEALAAAHKLPLSKVLSVSEALAAQNPGAAAPAFPVLVDHQRLLAPLQAAPALGADSAQILSGLGVDQLTLLNLQEAGVVPTP